MCGVAGSGKTTYAQQLEAQGYVRLSIDEEVWKRFGRVGVDYDASMYGKHSAAIEVDLRRRLNGGSRPPATGIPAGVPRTLG
jgi:predicted kinase